MDPLFSKVLIKLFSNVEDKLDSSVTHPFSIEVRFSEIADACHGKRHIAARKNNIMSFFSILSLYTFYFVF
ncbi:hypothetical protein [Methanosarcina sp. 2.H.A.1B.4]|uniref:hypothetical protein n=1 Tax=Methanosarcina sp. 2.H.A.1B.4 TaxID=1483600 RepID=UPI00138DD31D|nr:hypothetical protein [Methanosarcina sp. 2.H.A.1B.4]